MKTVNSLTSLSGLVLFLAGTGFCEPTLKSPLKGVSFQRVKAVRDPVPDVIAKRYQPLKAFQGRTAGHSAASVLGQAQKHSVSADYQNVTALTPWSTQYAIEVLWDDELLWMLFDTGSSDTWAVKSDFSCVGRMGTVYPQEACQFGTPTIADFRYGKIPDYHFSVTFGSGEHVKGPMGRSDITVAGMTVKEQQVGLANETYWYGNNVTCGILGLAYPSLTSAYYGEQDDERLGYLTNYSPFFTSMVDQGLVDPMFSVAIDRHSSGGLLAWGGLAPVETLSGVAAYTDLIIVSAYTEYSAAQTQTC
jgi:hypothetical protein